MKIELPHVGESVTEGMIGQWLKKVGDSVEKYEPLVEVVTDKVNMEMPSPVSGILTEILVKEGETIPMGTVIAEIEVAGEAESATAESAPPVAAAQESPAEDVDRTGVLLTNVTPVGPTGASGPITTGPQQQATDETARRKRYSPAVLRLAEEHAVNLDNVPGTGLSGRITRKDVQQHIDSGEAAPKDVAGPVAAVDESPPASPAPAEEERVPLTPVRRMIADHMVKSATEIPTAWSITEVDVTDLVLRRESVKEEFRSREGINITYLPFVVKAVAESLKDNPLLNSAWGGDSIVLKKQINIGVAVAAPSGLVVPVIHDADTLSVAGLTKRIDELTARAREGKLVLEDVQGGTFTVNNTGSLGSVASKPIINHPQAAIMTTEAIVKRPVVVEGDAIAVRSMMNICLTFDHRVMDGAEASAFTNAVKERLEAISKDTGIY
ncbi:MAG: 2-oxo acid dehydrogenase subunit E2 [Chloroflexi bacterium]|nr:2-oxo acid dehydrogenase subunit E2 [Chloroflexota bacterium]